MSSFFGAFRSATHRFGRSLVAFLLISILFQSSALRTHAFAGKPYSPIRDSEIVFGAANAEWQNDMTILSWNTGYESNVLGFNIWRESQNGRERLNRELIAGSVAKAANGVLDAGDGYLFIDQNAGYAAVYWIEAVFLSGRPNWIGPIKAAFGVGNSAVDQSKTLSGVAFESFRARPQSEKVDFPANALFLEKGAFSEESAARSAVPLPLDPNALKLEVRETGWYRIPATVMQENGFPFNSLNSWKMYVNNREMPITVNSDGSVEFFGAGIDTIQSDAGVYWLTYGSGTGKRNSRSTQKFTQSAPNYWTRVVAERRDRTMRLSGVINGERENWFSSYVSSTETVSNLNLIDIATESGESATVGVDLQGLGSNIHSILVELNGVEIGRINFSDYQRTEWMGSVPLSTLRNGANELKLRSIGEANDYSLLEAWRINYPRRLTAEGNRLQFSVPSRKNVKLRGFSSSRVRVFDVTNPEAVSETNPASRLEADGTYSVTLASSSSPRLFVAQGDGAVSMSVTGCTKNKPSNLRDTSNRATYVMIAPERFHSDLAPLRNAREAGGLLLMLVDPVDIYDEFGNGVRSAEAIHSFLQFAEQNWAVKPDYVLLVGDASVDPRNFTGLGGSEANLVPTMFTDTWNIEAVSDALLADLDGDSIEDVSLGRLPVRTSAELSAVITKILVHDSFTNEQILDRGALMVSDAYLGYDFETGSRTMAQSMPFGANIVFADLSGSEPAVFRQNVLNTMNSGPAVVNYFGHASVLFWASQQIYRVSDASGLANYSRPSLAVMLACLNGTFAETSIDSLSEATIKSPGGAFGVWASSGWNSAYEEEILGREFYRRVYAGNSVGDAIRQTKALFQTVDLRRTFIYFGDPSQKLLR